MGGKIGPILEALDKAETEGIRGGAEGSVADED